MSEFAIEGVDVLSFENFEDQGYTDEDALDLAQGLLVEAIPCLSTIYNDFNTAQKKVVKFAVFEMAKYIKIDYYNFDRATSPFQSETIGSYTYSKMSSAVRSGAATGVPAFDRAVSQLAGLCDISGGSGSFSSSSEIVIRPGYGGYLQDREKTHLQDIPGNPYPYRLGRF